MEPTVEQIKEILAGAPNGATYYCSNKQYWRVLNNEWQVREHGQDGYYWVNELPIYTKWISSLSDLNEILVQHEEIEKLKQERFAFAEQAVIQAVLMFGKEDTSAAGLGIWYREWYTQQLREQGDE